MESIGKIKLHAEPKPEKTVAMRDTREQLPWDLSPLPMVTGTLDFGDYTLAAMPRAIRIERKSLGDLIQCCGRERARFQREIDALIGFPHTALIVESSWAEIEQGNWRSRISPASVVGSLLGWQAQGLPVILAGTRERAQTLAAKMLFIVARRRWREGRQLLVDGEQGGSIA